MKTDFKAVLDSSDLASVARDLRFHPTVNPTPQVLTQAQIARSGTATLFSEARLRALRGHVDPDFLLRVLGEVERRYADRNFIRVDWPTVPLEELIGRVAAAGETTPFHRMCISMITHPQSDADTLLVLERWASEKSEATRYDYWRTVRVVAAALGKLQDWRPHLDGAWCRNGIGGRPTKISPFTSGKGGKASA